MHHKLTSKRVPTADLTTYHRNPRKGDVGRIVESLQENGQYRPLVVNAGTLTGRGHEVLAGNHTLEAARAEGMDKVWCVYVDVDDEQAAKIVAADNRTGDLGSYDDRLLAELLGDLPDLDGTGYDPGDLDDLLDKLEPDDEGTGGADFGQPVVSYTIVFDDDGQQDEWFAFVRWLRSTYPDHETVAGRLMAHVAEHAGKED